MNQFYEAQLRAALGQAADDLDLIAGICEKASGNEVINRLALVVKRYAMSARAVLSHCPTYAELIRPDDEDLTKKLAKLVG